ncbi:hypothetical protein HAX54_041833 [Datura stramonium]|uniref:Uncharacterized protein n=1 Tax=Datura stramonium TaxID=4076 RepID=A0ABS8W0P7_DATST|nr:hypothetical protein [Datura stramonium]
MCRIISICISLKNKMRLLHLSEPMDGGSATSLKGGGADNIEERSNGDIDGGGGENTGGGEDRIGGGEE